MNMDRVCGNCVYGADAHDRYGNLDPNYVICQIKEAENRQRKPSRFDTLSAVSRMHHHREACLHWKAVGAGSYGEQPLPMESAGRVSQVPESLYEQMYGGSGGSTDLDQDASPYTVPTFEHSPAHGQSGQAAWHPPPVAHVYQDTHVATAEKEAEIKRLKTQLMQQEQMVASLQHQSIYMSEEVTRLKEELEKANTKLEKLKPFDVALFAEVNYFSLLGVKENASPEQIKDAYRARMKILHPDRFINISQRLNQAYETLMDAEKRRKYLLQIKGKK